MFGEVSYVRRGLICLKRSLIGIFLMGANIVIGCCCKHKLNFIDMKKFYKLLIPSEGCFGYL